MDKIKVCIVSACGLGFMPIAPGSFGALLGVVIHLPLLLLPGVYRTAGVGLAFLLVCAANNLLAPWAQKYWDDNDPKHFVLDEVAGYLLVPFLVYLLTPVLFKSPQTWQLMFWGFMLFRVFDILKIPPARQIDRNTHTAWGILLDDLVASVYAVVVLYLFQLTAPRLGLSYWLWQTS